MTAPYPPPLTRRTPPPRTELAHHMLVRAAAGLVGCRADSAGKTVFVDGAPAPLAWALAVSLLDAYGWLVWWRDPCATCNPATWWCCCLSPAGDRALRAWDHQLLRKVT